MKFDRLLKERRWFRVLGLLAWVLSIAGCASGWPAAPLCPTVAVGVRYCLQPAAAAPAFSLQQSGEIRIGARRFNGVSVIENDAQGLELAVLSPSGPTLLGLSWRAGAVAVRGPVPVQFDWSQLVALLQIALWPHDQVQAGLQAGPQGPAYVVTRANERTLYLANQAVLTVSFQGELPRPRWLRLQLEAWDLELIMQQIDDEAGS